MAAGKIIGGIVLLLIGIIIAGAGMTISSIQSNNLQRCNTFTGQLGQSLDPETYEICTSAPMYQGISNAAIIMGVILSIIGIVLVVLGVVSRSKRKEQRNEDIAYSPNASVSDTKIYCRYCGKERDTLGEFCSRCGRNSQSSSTRMNICQNCSSPMSDDSSYCANCGIKFQVL
jgi:uncharacterized membrane protein